MTDQELKDKFHSSWEFEPNTFDHYSALYAYIAGYRLCEKIYEEKLQKYLDEKGI